ncbi:MAG: MBL fold metallo-hydrolase [Christensenellales bacterium]|jgi:L-ascorbate 6-phosphate lactonase
MLTGKALMDEILSYRPRDGEIAFWWLGQISYIVKVDGIIFAFDPYLNPRGDRLIPPFFTPQELVGADYVLGSHNHGDHIDHTALPGIAAASPETRFVIPAMFLDELAQKLGISKDRFIPLDEALCFTDEQRGVTIRAIASAHEFLDRDPQTGYHPSLGYIVEAGGVRIYHSGDTCKYEGLETRLKSAGPIDLMIIPINGRDGRKYRSGIIGNMTFNEAVDLAGVVEPRLVCPSHYDMFAGNSADPILFADYMEAKYPLQKFWIGGHGVRVSLYADE